MNGGKQVSAWRKVLAVVVLVVVIIVSTIVGALAGGGWRGAEALAPGPFGGPRPFARAAALSIVIAFLSVAALLFGMALYAVSWATRLFIFDLSRPVWPTFKTRLFFANIVVPMPIMLGIGGLVAALGWPLLVSLDMAHEIALPVLAFVPFLLLQIVTIWFNIWRPCETRLTHARLLALGIEPGRIEQGIFLGISDPAKKSIRKFGLIEDDVGMLWITPDELVYEGDNDAFRIRREQCLSIERVADPGSVSAYFGNVNIILTFGSDDAGPRRVRLHPESSMTMTGTARASDHLADELERWKDAVADEGQGSEGQQSGVR